MKTTPHKKRRLAAGREKNEALSVVPHFSLSSRHVSPFLTWGDFHVCSRFACATIPEEKMGITHGLSQDLQSFCLYFDLNI